MEDTLREPISHGKTDLSPKRGPLLLLSLRLRLDSIRQPLMHLCLLFCLCERFFHPVHWRLFCHFHWRLFCHFHLRRGLFPGRRKLDLLPPKTQKHGDRQGEPPAHERHGITDGDQEKYKNSGKEKGKHAYDHRP